MKYEGSVPQFCRSFFSIFYLPFLIFFPLTTENLFHLKNLSKTVENPVKNQNKVLNALRIHLNSMENVRSNSNFQRKFPKFSYNSGFLQEYPRLDFEKCQKKLWYQVWAPRNIMTSDATFFSERLAQVRAHFWQSR